jgi:hypothetical protein
MKNLAKRIKHELQIQNNKHGYCTIYEDELRAIWPINIRNREAEIAEFAIRFGFKLSFYKLGQGAVFQKQSPETEPSADVVLPAFRKSNRGGESAGALADDVFADTFHQR